jgi:hypothetical protein
MVVIHKLKEIKMRGYFQLVVILVACLPLAVNASLYKFEYTGQIFYLTGNGLGYQMDDSVGGALTFDLADSNGDIWAEDYIVNYYSKNNADFVRGYQPENLGQNNDSLLVYDGADADYSIPRLDAGIDIVDANYVETGPSDSLARESRTYGMQVNVVFDDFDWLTNGKINTFSFDEADQLASTISYGVYYDTRSVVDSNGNQSWPSEFAWFRLNSAKLSVVDVPEPSAPYLLMLGGFVLFLRRRFVRA